MPPLPAAASLRVAVVGAGVGGLTAALALARRGARRVTVLERASEERHGRFAGLGFSLAPNGLTALRALGVVGGSGGGGGGGGGLSAQLHPLRNFVNAGAGGAPLAFAGGARGIDIGFLRRDFGEYLSGVARANVILALRAALAETDAMIDFSTEVTGVESGVGAAAGDEGAPVMLRLRRIAGSGGGGSDGSDGAGGGESAATGPFDLVVGADGIHSRLRSFVYGRDDAAPSFSGVNLYYGLTRAEALAPAERGLLAPHTLYNWYGNGTSALAFGVGQGPADAPSAGRSSSSLGSPGFSDDVECASPEAFVFAVAVRERVPAAESWDRASVEGGLAAVLDAHYSKNAQLAALIGAARRSAAEAAAAGRDAPAPLAHFGLHYRPPVAPWHRGRVVLLGDAAHATLPHLGQGANMAIDDAVCLAEAVAGEAGGAGGASGLAGALAAYERKRLKKTGDIVKLSKVMGDVNNAEGALLCAVRDTLLGLSVGAGAVTKGLAGEIVKDPVIPLRPRP
jgi:salicylate hydroxylase